MTLALADRVFETSISTGTGPFTLQGAVAGFQGFSVLGDGAKTTFFIDDADATGLVQKWMDAIGTVSVSGGVTTLSVDQVLSSSNAGAPVNFGSGTKNLRGGLGAKALPITDENLNDVRHYGVGAGSANVHAVTLPYTPLAYSDGMLIVYRVLTTNTTASAAVNVNGLGNKNLRINGLSPGVGVLSAGTLIVALYKASNNTFEIISVRTKVNLTTDVDGVLPPANGGVPAGAVMAFAMNTVPSGWLECAGQAVNRTTYADLYTALGNLYGAGDGSTTFNLPDLRGEFIRGWDNSRGVDVSRAIASSQSDLLKSHVHGQRTGGTATSGPQVSGGGGGTTVAGLVNGGITGNTLPQTLTDAAGGAETRPRNVAMMYCIKT